MAQKTGPLSGSWAGLPSQHTEEPVVKIPIGMTTPVNQGELANRRLERTWTAIPLRVPEFQV